jgi:nucleoside phosphorylase
VYEENERSEANVRDERSKANGRNEVNERTERDQPDAAKAGPTQTAIVVRTGVGPRRSRKAVRDDHLFTGQAIAVAGIGRALAARVQPGDVVVADQVRTDALTEGVVPPTRLVPSAPRIAALLRQHGLTVHVGSVISTDNRVNDTVRDRLAMTRALVADRESAWLLAACGKTPIACVRVAAHRSMRGWRKTARTLRIVSATLTEWAAS